jgi:hypothetical protein
MSKKRKTELRREDVVSYRQQLEYSRQRWQEEQNDPFRSLIEFQPIEEFEWESPHFWLNEGLRQRAANKLARELGIGDDKRKR